MQLNYTVSLADEGARLSDFLRRRGLTSGLIRGIKYQGGGMTADGRPIHTNERVVAGQNICVTLPQEPPTAVPPVMAKSTVTASSSLPVRLIT